jgi:hypothetical protein
MRKRAVKLSMLARNYQVLASGKEALSLAKE